MGSMTEVLNKIAKENRELEIKECRKKGYWLVRSSDHVRFFISEQVDCLALERVADKYLADNNYQYSIEYCMGLDIQGRIVWANNTFDNLFI